MLWKNREQDLALEISRKFRGEYRSNMALMPHHRAFPFERHVIS
jgi:hypothetical protein